MADERPTDRVAIAAHLMQQGIAEMDQAWHRRRCPAPNRFWCVALGESHWNADETAHLAVCTRCAAQVDRVGRELAAKIPSPVAPAISKLLTVRERLRSRRGMTQLRFVDEVALTGELERSRGEHWLRLRHTSWPEATMLRVALDPPFALKRTWSRLLVLRRESNSSVTQLRVSTAFPDDNAERCLTVQAIPFSELPTSTDALTKSLCEAIDLARIDDPSSVMAPLGRERSAWHLWTLYALQGPLKREQRYVLERVRDVLADLDRIGDSTSGPRLYLG